MNELPAAAVVTVIKINAYKNMLFKKLHNLTVNTDDCGVNDQ